MTHEADTGHHAQLIEWLSIHVELYRSSGSPAGRSYCSTEELVLTLGRWGLPSALPPGRARGPARMCYSNSSSYSETHGLTYVEGYGLTNLGFACAHAWCVDEHGYVHDPTWPDGLGVAYLGIPFSTSYIRTFNETLGNACLLHDAHIDGHRTLREGLPDDAILPIGEPAAKTTFIETQGNRAPQE